MNQFDISKDAMTTELCRNIQFTLKRDGKTGMLIQARKSRTLVEEFEYVGYTLEWIIYGLLPSNILLQEP